MEREEFLRLAVAELGDIKRESCDPAKMALIMRRLLSVAEEAYLDKKGSPELVLQIFSMVFG
ncbi:MAG: hypothetical protein KDA84_30190, partial [Planctomycetaceae bacterium]|nr:hypothetical protein [Planctomycetaceae bacterium]